MKSWPFIAVIAGIILLWFIVNRTSESFVPEFLDQGNVRKTAERSSSSYEQDTNHFRPVSSIAEPIQGVQTPFRVNMYNSYMV